MLIRKFYSNVWHDFINDNIKIVLSFIHLILFQALNGFLMILTCEGEVFFATHSIESYLGFHQVKTPFLRWYPGQPSIPLSTSHKFMFSRNNFRDNSRRGKINYIFFQFVKAKGVKVKIDRDFFIIKTNIFIKSYFSVRFIITFNFSPEINLYDLFFAAKPEIIPIVFLSYIFETYYKISRYKISSLACGSQARHLCALMLLLIDFFSLQYFCV